MADKRGILERLIRKLPLSLGTFATGLADTRKRLEQVEKRLSKSLAQIEKNQRGVESRLMGMGDELHRVSDRVTSLLDDAFLKRRPIYDEAAAALAGSLKKMASLPDEDAVHVVFITDSGYALPTAIAISSMLRHRAPSTKYRVSVVAQELSEDAASLFSAFGKAVSLTCADFLHEDLFKEHHHVSRAALLKFDLASLFPNDAKILYLDGDILVFKDLSALWTTPLDKHYGAVVKDYKYCQKGFAELVGHEAYFNSGVMLLNLDRCREDDIAAKLIAAKKSEPVSMFMDQTAFNMVLGGDVVYLPPEYNMLQASLGQIGGVGGNSRIAGFFDMGEKDFEKAWEEPAILHLAGKLKPWSSRNAPNFELWHDEAKIFHSLRHSLTTLPGA